MQGVPNDLINVKRVAEKLHISEKTVRKLIDSGELKCYRIGNKILLSEEQISNYLIKQENK